MDWSKKLYIFMLSAIIVMSGCFGSGTTDGQNDTETTVNHPPVVYAHGSQACESCPSVWVISAIDIDGNVTSMGIDTDIDGTVDIALSGDFSTPTRYDVPAIHPGTDIVDREGLDGCVGRLNVIATDDDGASTIVPHQFSLDC
jgi:hypothetical protein